MLRNNKGRFTKGELLTEEVKEEIKNMLINSELLQTDIADIISSQTGAKYLYVYRVVNDLYRQIKTPQLTQRTKKSITK